MCPKGGNVAIDLLSLEKRIRNLQKLRDLVADDEMMEALRDQEVFAMLKESLGVKGHGGAQPTATLRNPSISVLFPDASDDDGLPAPGTLRRAVYDVALSLGPKFTAAEIVTKLEAQGHTFDAADHAIAVNTALRALQNKNLVRLVEQGSGRRGNRYEITKGGTK